MEIEEKIDQYLQARRHLTPSIHPLSSALVIIDMQNYQVKETSPIIELNEKFVPGMLEYFLTRVDEMVNPNISRLSEFFRKNNMPVYYTKFACRRRDCKDYATNIRTFNEFSKNVIGKYIFPSIQDPLANIIPELNPKDIDTIILKTTSGTFSSTDLEHQLRSLGIDTVIIVGVVTHMCVESTTRIASDLGFNVFVVDDACAGWSPILHNASLRAMELFYANIITTEEILKTLDEQIKNSRKGKE